MTLFQDGTPIYPLSTLVDVLDSQRIPVKAADRSVRVGDVPYYGAAGQVGWIDEAIYDEDLILLGEDGVQFFDTTKPKAYLVSGPAWVNNHAHVLRARPGLMDRRYLLYFLNAFDYSGYANGTTRLKLTQSAMNRIPVPCPSLSDQRDIASSLEDHFSRLDAAKEDLRTSLTRTDHLIMADLAKRVSGSEFERGAERLAFGNHEIYLPVGWKSLTIGQVATRIQYGSSEKTHQVPEVGDVPILRMGNIQKGQLRWNDLKYLSTSDHPDLPILQAGDLLFNRTNSAELVGKCAVVKHGVPEASFASYLIRAQFDDTVDPEWAAMTINSPYGREHIARIASQQVGQANVNGSKLKAFPIPVPPRHIQTELIGEHQDVSDTVRAVQRQVDVLQRRSAALRHSLLAAAFSGRSETARERQPHMHEEQSV